MRRTLLWVLPLSGVTACTFPDVEYADGGTCPELAGCEAGAKDCDTIALSARDGCMQGCTMMNPSESEECMETCEDSLYQARVKCSDYCTGCAPPACASATAMCQEASGL
jgi:hypothetical protein